MKLNYPELALSTNQKVANIQWLLPINRDCIHIPKQALQHIKWVVMLEIQTTAIDALKRGEQV